MPAIAIFINNLAGGGAERVIYLLAKHLFTDFQIHIILLEAKGHYYQELRQRNDIQFHILDGKTNNTITYALRLRKTLKTIKPDCLLSFLWYPSIVSVLAFPSPPFPLICCERTNPRKNFKNNLKGRIWGSLLKHAYREAACVCTNSLSLETMVKEMYPFTSQKTQVIQNGMDTILLTRKAAEYTPPASPLPRVVAAGRLSEAKNYPMLIEAFEQLLKKTDAELHIIGDGEEKERLEQLIHSKNLENRVFLQGFLENPYPWFHHAAVYAMSSAWEGFPNALAEGMFLNGHVVSTDCPTGPSEIIEHEVDGLLVENYNTGQMTEALLRMLTDNELRERVYSKSREVAARFSLEKMVCGFRDLLNKHIKAHAG